ncbi:IucA/IucC family protein [Streptomyces candidus]|uniref:Siderophore synthetase component n=1 Tax=Streptomyces candidus TaxID=67283 RepID=A0A7X0HCW4_9ACTN|nr:IucA/IucC family protein [Streptomyces candidus]MBB6435249.1 siderophore synthetase component [Streptomyces candidus]GHH40290.1 siderophore biosynthesis protein IucA [Streptomyces candidus]
MTVQTSPQAAAWKRAGSLITEKMLGELSYEYLFEPVADTGPVTEGADPAWRLDLPGDVTYRFRARHGAFRCWVVTPGSATRHTADGHAPADDPRILVTDARTVLGLSGMRLADVLSELTATVANEAMRLERPITAAELAALPYDLADGHLTGHPRIVVNKGRVGFSAADRARLAPEARNPFAVRWTAVHRDLASFRSVAGLDEQTLLAEELGEATRQEFAERLAATGADLADYVWMPIHPWQWDEIVGTLYAAEIATGRIVLLGDSADTYVPHQTVRTLANVTHPTRRDVKTACSVRNTLVYRGLNSAATLAGPAVTEWLLSIHESDALLRDEYRFDLLGEVAAVSVTHPLFGSLEELPYRFHETLGVLWREPLRTRVGENERAISLATLPYRDHDGRSVVAHLITTSGMSPQEWFGKLYDLILTPLLHWLYRYGVAYCPHSQNLVLITDPDGRPLRVMIKDFAQGVDLVDADLPVHDTLAEEARKDMLRWPAPLMAQSLFSSVFSGQIRFLAEIAHDDFGYPRAEMWEQVRTVIRAYADRFPEDAKRYPDLDLFAPDVERVCLNREHLAGEGFERVDRDEEFDVRFGRVPNPLSAPDPEGAW